jgi:GNAT superfamily N-acetyltransferase
MECVYTTPRGSVFNDHFGSYFENTVLSDRFYEYLVREKGWEQREVDGIPNIGNDPLKQKVLRNQNSGEYCLEEDWRMSLEPQKDPDVISTAKELGEEAVKSEYGYKYNTLQAEGLKIVEVRKSSQENPETSKLLEEIGDRPDISYESTEDYNYIYKLKVSDKIVGVALVDNGSKEPTPTPERFRDIPHLRGIYVKKEQRRNGFGKLLLDTLCKQENIESLVVDAETQKTHFYAKTYPHIVYLKKNL